MILETAATGVAADDELLLLGEFDFDPGAAALASLVERIRPLGDQAFELEFISQAEECRVGRKTG
jgi:hypothetical protein